MSLEEHLRKSITKKLDEGHPTIYVP